MPLESLNDLADRRDVEKLIVPSEIVIRIDDIYALLAFLIEAAFTKLIEQLFAVFERDRGVKWLAARNDPVWLAFAPNTLRVVVARHQRIRPNKPTIIEHVRRVV